MTSLFSRPFTKPELDADYPVQAELIERAGLTDAHIFAIVPWAGMGPVEEWSKTNCTGRFKLSEGWPHSSRVAFVFFELATDAAMYRLRWC